MLKRVERGEQGWGRVGDYHRGRGEGVREQKMMERKREFIKVKEGPKREG